MEIIQGRFASLCLGVCCRGASLEPVLADPDAARAVATNRFVVGHLAFRMVRILVIPQANLTILHFLVARLGEIGINCECGSAKVHQRSWIGR